MELKSISEETREKLRSLYGSGSLWTRLVNGSKQRVELLREIARSGETAAIPELAEFLFDKSGEVREATSEAIHGLIQSVAVGQFPELDQRMRTGSRSYYLENDWSYMAPADVERLAMLLPGTSMCGLASFHSNGRVREAAIRVLAVSGDGSELPFLLLRLNDWVAPVRTAARHAVTQRLKPGYVPHFLRSLPLVIRLESCGRADHSGILNEIRTLIECHECRPFLLEAFASGSVAMRRACMRLLSDGEGSERSEILKLGLLDSDQVIRLWAARQVLADASPSELESIVDGLLRDRSMPVRREALQALATKLPDVALPALKRALLDTSKSMRETARYYLKQSVGFDVAAFYREMIRRGEEALLAIAIRGTGETGGRDDAEIVKPYLSSPKPSLRKAAVFSVAQLCPEAFEGELMELLGDTSPGVSKETCKALLANMRLVGRTALLSKLNENNSFYVRRNALRLLLHLGKWKQLAPLLDLCCTEDERLSPLAQAGIIAWFENYNVSFVAPDRQQIDEIQAALVLSAPFLSKRMLQELEAILKHWKEA